MISLFLDSASAYMMVGIYRDTEELYLKIEENDNQLSEKLLPAVEKAFDTVGIPLSNIDRIYVVNGPGSFTGVRIGCSVAKTIAWALKKEIIPISELELLASTDTGDQNKIPMIDARHNSVYTGIYDSELNLLMEDCYTSLDEILPKINENTVVISADSYDFETMLPKVNIPLIIEKHKQDTPVNPHGLNPNYLKRTEAEEKHDANCR